MANLPFTAVAASQVSTETALFWTRYASAADPTVATPLRLELSTSPDFAVIARQVLTSTRPDADQTAKVTVADLPEGTAWFYRFTTLRGADRGAEVSRTGRLRIAPLAETKTSLSFGIGGCANGQYAPFPFLDWSGAGQPNLDLFWMLGDVAYGKRVDYPDYAGGLSPEVANPLDPTQDNRPKQTLADYHQKYRLNLTATDPANADFASLASLYAAQGVYSLFDNNDLQGDTFLEAGGSPRDMVRAALSDARQPGKPFPYLFEAEGTSNTDFLSASNYFNQKQRPPEYVNQTPEFQLMLKAWRDYQPVLDPDPSQETDGVFTSRYYWSKPWGANAQLIQLDDRSYRDAKFLTSNDSDGDDDTRRNPLGADSPHRTMLGVEQFAWLKEELLAAKRKGTTWIFLAISSPIDALGAPGQDGAIEAAQTSVDAKSWWGGYRHERNELLRFIVDNGIRNVVFLTSDDHEGRVNELLYSRDPSRLTEGLIPAPGVFTVVSSPLGAGRPSGLIGSDPRTDTPLLGSHFSQPLRLTYGKTKTIVDYPGGFQELAQTYAGTMVAEGLNPVGLDADFPGLASLERYTSLFDDDPEYRADVNDPRPWDFWTPQTYHWAQLDLARDGQLTVTFRGMPAYGAQTAFASGPVAAEDILKFSVRPSVHWQSALSASAGRLSFGGDVSLMLHRLDQGEGLASFGLRQGGEERRLLRDASGAIDGSLNAKTLFASDPLVNWSSTEGRAVGTAAWASGAGLGGASWQPVCWREGQEQALQSLEVEGNRAIATFNGGLVAQYALEATGTATASELRPLVRVQRLGAFANALAFYEVSDVQGSVAGLRPGQNGYLEAALADAITGERLVEARALPAYGQTAELNALVLRPDRRYGMLLLIDGSRDRMVSSFAAANPGFSPHVLSFGSDNRGMVFGFEDLLTSQSLRDSDFNDLIVTVSSATVLTG